jgi:hypothetical protein
LLHAETSSEGGPFKEKGRLAERNPGGNIKGKPL